MGYKYKTDHNYFDKIDDEYKAYILGFIYADGCIRDNIGERQKHMTITLQEEDGYILNKLARDVMNKDIDIYQPPSVILKGWKKRAHVKITSDYLCNRLILLGCNINKSRVGMRFPKLVPEMIPHFIRGFMDGDGSIIIKKLGYKYKRKTTWYLSNAHVQRYKLKVAFSSTDKDFLEKIIKYLPIKKFYIGQKKRVQIVYTLWIENPEDVQNCLTYLYNNSHYFLKRKYDKFQEFNKTIKSEAIDTSIERLETT